MTISTGQQYALAIDLGGTKVEAALVDPTGAVYAPSRFRAATGPQKSSDELALAVDEVLALALAALPADAQLLGVGIGSAGPINEAEGKVSPLNLPVWREYPLRDQVVASVPDGTPVTLRMDGICITLAEHWVGAGKGYNNVMGMIVSTGIGGGLILGGVTVSGPTGNAGHIGHVEVAGMEDPCPCGGAGCVEAVASGPNTVRWAREHGFQGSTGEELGAAYRAGDPVAIAAVEHAGRAIGQVIASATSLVDLDIVAIGGGFSHVTPDLFDHMRAAVARRRNFSFVTKVKIVPTGLSSDGPLIGAAALIHRSAVVA
ncbi:ROK family protein [Lacisediminihabitans changchengi]|uniref:ROK family protein n=1 Tax=Lacisediminihabitans changchengi TaxID=2787634 RepID=A0A934SLI0_9MICO|nr:ROK family protein [Lacisediminihabitans changchengi]MBK4347546.1 ROK family protein [Lacisediminihabitans changchengi]